MSKINDVCKIFVSSTYEDMIPYRNAVTDVINSLEQLPIGMEHFVSSPEKSLDVCLADVRRCNIYVLLVGMRYGSIDVNTGKSYTEREYEEALKYNIPVLSFIIDENECAVLPKYVDIGENAEKLQAFKKRLYEAHMASRFKSVDDLKQLVLRAVQTQVNRISEELAKDKQDPEKKDDFHAGALIYKKFIIMPERYKDSEVSLRVHIKGYYGTWKQRDALFKAYGLPPGDALRINDIRVMGVDLSDIDPDGADIALYAYGKAADWLLDNGVTTGSVVEGKFRLMYELVDNITPDGDARIAAMLLIDGLSVQNRKKKN